MQDGPFKIESLAYTGLGVAHDLNGKTLFVDGAIPGDTVKVAYTKEYERYNQARITEICDPSQHRIQPLCPHAGMCGGCSLQHMHYSQQVLWKRSFVVDALRRIACIEEAEDLVSETLMTGLESGYRNKIELVPSPGKKGMVLGYHARQSEEVIPVSSCLLLLDHLEDIPGQLSGALSYALGDNSEKLKRVTIRASKRTGDCELSLWMEPSSCSRQFLAKVVKSVMHTSSLVRVLTKSEPARRNVSKVEVISGKGFWSELLAGFTFKVSATSFFQVNTLATELLIDKVIESVGEEVDTVLDLYCGVGTFTLPLAKRNLKMTAIESEKSSIRDLRRNLAENGLAAEVVGGGVEYELSKLGKGFCIVVDPPRKGLSSVALKALVDAKPQILVYVSCNPATLGRDLRFFLASGFVLESVTPIDLFPQTYHVESIALLRRASTLS